jgi:hypothetical protein
MLSKRTVLLTLALLGGSAATWTTWASPPAGPAKDVSKEEFVVHEWGTFSTFSGSDGAFLKFYPDDRDLPQFVYSRHRYIKGGLPDVFVSLETPVLYCYSDRERNASVAVDFPEGRMTEWYPNVSRETSAGLRWEDIRIAPRSQPILPQERGKSRYYAARETEAAPLQVTTGKNKRENEKFLFYRGVSDARMPLVVQAQRGGKFTLKNTGTEAIPAFVLVRVHNGAVSFKTGDHLSAGVEVTMDEPREESSTEKLGTAMVDLLIHAGLFPKEARAMVKTWNADWFGEEGTRVLYLVAAGLTEELLPLRITPKPSEVRRVMVGRHDVLTPEKEDDIVQLVRKLDGPVKAEAKDAEHALNRLGRYRWPAQQAARARLKTAKSAGVVQK